LTLEDQLLMKRTIVDSVPSFTNSSLDYYCPYFKALTSVLYDFWAGGKMVNSDLT